MSVGEKDREFVPVGLTTSVSKDSGEGNAAASKGSEKGTAPADATGTVSVTTTLNAADVYVGRRILGEQSGDIEAETGQAHHRGQDVRV